MSKSQTKRTFKVIRSTMGSDLTFPTKTVDGRETTLTARWDRDVFLPREFEEDPYVLNAEAEGHVIISESDRMPQGPEPYPDEIEKDVFAKGWLTSLLYGPYTDQFKAYFEEWGNAKLCSPAVKGSQARISELKTRVLPIIRCAIEREMSHQNRANLLADLNQLEQFIVKEEWSWDVQSASRRNQRP